MYQRDQDGSTKKLMDGDQVVFTGPMQACKDRARELLTDETRQFIITSNEGNFLAQCTAKRGDRMTWTGRLC